MGRRALMCTPPPASAGKLAAVNTSASVGPSRRICLSNDCREVLRRIRPSARVAVELIRTTLPHSVGAAEIAGHVHVVRRGKDPTGMDLIGSGASTLGQAVVAVITNGRVN